MSEPSNTDHNCKSASEKKNRWKKNIPKAVFRTVSMIYSFYRLISKMHEIVKDFLA
ncbi:hypothetical protein XACG102_11260001 [Xanthomonas citri pv. citri]|nr:hypothetical protein XACG102_11260001 [Xanthomonas citri pv. citri]